MDFSLKKIEKVFGNLRWFFGFKTLYWLDIANVKKYNSDLKKMHLIFIFIFFIYDSLKKKLYL